MANNVKQKEKTASVTRRKHPPGRIKIAVAFRALISQKEFNSITTAEISRISGVNEALIYRYFGDKRGIMHQILYDIFQDFQKKLLADLERTQGALNKLKVLIKSHFNLYCADYPIARILLLEVRNDPGYYTSETYELVRWYSGVMKEILDDGLKKHEIRNDIPVKSLRQMIMGAIEHMCLPAIIYQKSFSPEVMAEEVIAVILEGIAFRERSDAQ